MTDTVTLTDPITGKTWTSGKRGRKPKFVMDLEAAGTVIPKKIVATAPGKIKTTEQLPAVPGALRIWRWVGQAGECGDNDEHQKSARCMIVAANPTEAIKVANPTFLYPIGSSEFALMWQEVETDLVSDIHKSGVDVTKPAVWQSWKGGWEQRNRRLTSAAV
jgi:hypothetical protein